MCLRINYKELVEWGGREVELSSDLSLEFIWVTLMHNIMIMLHDDSFKDNHRSLSRKVLNYFELYFYIIQRIKNNIFF